MPLDGRQIFVWEGSVDRVSGLIKRYVDRVGSVAAVGLDSEKPSSDMARRAQREFTLSDSRNGIISIWQDGVWGDKKLARYLSKELETRSIWLALSTMIGGWAYVICSRRNLSAARRRLRARLLPPSYPPVPELGAPK